MSMIAQQNVTEAHSGGFNIKRLAAVIPAMTKEQVKEIWDADRKVEQLAAEWNAYIRIGNHASAKRVRTQSNNIKRNILSKYQIIL